MRSVKQDMQWEYKIVALGLIVDATQQNQREKHEQILNDLGRDEWEAVAYIAQSDTVLLKRPAKHLSDRSDPATPVITGGGSPRAIRQHYILVGKGKRRQSLLPYFFLRFFSFEPWLRTGSFPFFS